MQPAGNYYDKYRTTNPAARWLMNGFLGSFETLLGSVGEPASALEVGCGEGELTIRIAQKTGAVVDAFDISADVVAEARQRASAAGVGDRIRFRADTIYDLSPDLHAADLVVCCEVLEHLDDPHLAVDRLAEVCKGHLIASVPREPVWRVLNMARGKYWSDLGNTPGHYQHWSTRGFRQLLERRFEVIALKTPLPWSMALCRPRK